MLRRGDVVSVLREVDEVRVVGGTVVRAGYRTHVLAARRLVGGCWFVSACAGCSDLERLEAEAESMARTADPERCGVPESFEVGFYSGRLSLGSRSEALTPTDEVLGLLEEYRLPGYEHSATLRRLRITKNIRAEDLAEALEEKSLVEVRVALRCREGWSGTVELSRVVVEGLGESVEGVLEKLLRIARDRAKALSAARRPSLTEMGRAEVVLLREASTALFHELSHLLAGLRGRAVLGRRLFEGSDVRVHDSPGDLRRPTARFFDDEGVVARRRWLVEGGSAIDAHHSIRTAYEAGSYPGSTHGLLGEVGLLHTSLVVESGDWKDEELLEETKRGFAVDGAASSSLEEGYVRIVPQAAFRVERGELREPVRIRAVRIPLTRPIRVLGVGRTGYTAFTREPEEELVSETSPPVRVEAFVEIV